MQKKVPASEVVNFYKTHAALLLDPEELKSSFYEYQKNPKTLKFESPRGPMSFETPFLSYKEFCEHTAEEHTGREIERITRRFRRAKKDDYQQLRSWAASELSELEKRVDYYWERWKEKSLKFS